jgi:hypothetical protein
VQPLRQTTIAAGHWLGGVREEPHLALLRLDVIQSDHSSTRTARHAWIRVSAEIVGIPDGLRRHQGPRTPSPSYRRPAADAWSPRPRDRQVGADRLRSTSWRALPLGRLALALASLEPGLDLGAGSRHSAGDRSHFTVEPRPSRNREHHGDAQIQASDTRRLSPGRDVVRPRRHTAEPQRATVRAHGGRELEEERCRDSHPPIPRATLAANDPSTTALRRISEARGATQ